MQSEPQPWLVNFRVSHPDPDLRARAELANRAGISKVHLVKIERGERRASPAVQQSLAEALDVSVDDVFPADGRKTPQAVLEVYLRAIRARREEGPPDPNFERDMEWLGEDVDALDEWESPVIFLDDDTLLIDGAGMPSELERAEASVEHNARQIARREERGQSTVIHERGLQRAELRLEKALGSIKQARAKSAAGRTRSRQPRPQRKRRSGKSASSSSDDPGEPHSSKPARGLDPRNFVGTATEELERAGIVNGRYAVPVAARSRHAMGWDGGPSGGWRAVFQQVRICSPNGSSFAGLRFPPSGSDNRDRPEGASQVAPLGRPRSRRAWQALRLRARGGDQAGAQVQGRAEGGGRCELAVGSTSERASARTSGTCNTG